MFERLRKGFGLTAYRVALARNMRISTLRKQELTVPNPKMRDIEFYWRLAQRHGWTGERFLETMFIDSRLLEEEIEREGGKRYSVDRLKPKTTQKLHSESE